MCFRCFYKCFQGKRCYQKFSSVIGVFHFIKAKCPSSEDSSLTKNYLHHEISIPDSAFVISSLLYFLCYMLFVIILLYHHWTSIIDCGDKIIIALKHPLDNLSTFVNLVQNIYSELLHIFSWETWCHYRYHTITFVTYLIVWLFL